LSSHADRLLDRLGSISPAVRCSYDIGSQHVAVHYLSEQLHARLHPSLSHLSIATDDPAELTIIAQLSQASPLPLTGEEWSTVCQRGVQHEIAQRVTSASFICGDNGRLDLISPARHLALSSFRDVSDIPAWDVATPFRDILQQWFRGRDGHLIHGAVVADGRSAVALVGASGSGKSSTAFACLRHSALECLGDDIFLARRIGRQWQAFSLYNACKLLPHDVDRFSKNLVPLDDSIRCDGKPTFYLYPTFADRLPRRRPLVAILLPRVAGTTATSFSPAKPADAWRALVPSTLILTSTSQHGAAWMTILSRRVPAWWLNVGAHREEIPSRIAELITLAVQIDVAAQTQPDHYPA
jgi:hypothetical protein